MLFMSCVCHAFTSVYAALLSPEGKGLTSWLLFVMLILIFYFHIWYPGTKVVHDCIDS